MRSSSVLYNWSQRYIIRLQRNWVWTFNILNKKAVLNFALFPEQIQRNASFFNSNTIYSKVINKKNLHHFQPISPTFIVILNEFYYNIPKMSFINFAFRFYILYFLKWYTSNFQDYFKYILFYLSVEELKLIWINWYQMKNPLR